MAQGESATAPEGIQLNQQLDEKIIPLIESKFAELLEIQTKFMSASKNEEAVHAKPEVSPPKAEVSGNESRGLLFWERMAVIVVGLGVIVSAAFYVGGLSSDVENLDKQIQIRFDDVDERLDKMDDLLDDFKDRLIRIENHLLNPQQKQAE